MKLRIYLALILCAVSFTGFSQTPGLIYSRASGLGQSVLDPNNDGYTSLTTSGFSGTDYGSNSELNMITMPGIVDEPNSDQSRGPSGGFTDLVNNGTNHSAYILIKNVGGTDYFIARFRLGGASSASKGYSIAFDTDSTFGDFPTTYNPGFEKEVVLETGNNGRVVVYTHSSGGATVSQTYSIGVYSQRSIALSTINGDADYFYDFFVPLSDLGISGNVRMAATTVINSTSALTGNVSDVNGIDDQDFDNNANAIYTAYINSFPSTSLSGLTEGSSFSSIKSYIPTISGSITSSSTSISGTSLEADGTTITIYVDGVSVGTTTVTSNAWSYTLGASLSIGQVVTATATASGKSESTASSSTTVTSESCYVARPTVTNRSNGAKTLTGTWPGTPSANTIEIKVYEQTNGALTFTDVTPSTTYVTTGGTFTTAAITGMGNGVVYYLTATDVSSGCVSVYSEPSTHNGNLSTITTAPSITTASVLASTGSRTINVQNLYAGDALLLLYVNGTLKSTSSAIAQNGSNAFSISGLNEGDTITARAQASTGSFNLSGRSNKLLVSGAGGQSATPIMNEGYVAGSGQTVSGTSSEDAGTSIYVYSGSTLIGTTTVDIYGNWSITNLTLTGGDTLTAYADATGKSLSTASTGVTVASSTPTTPVVTTSPLTVGLTSISGTSTAAVSGDSIEMYVDGALLTTVVASASWTVNFNSTDLYNGAEVTFVRTNSSGVSSAATATQTVQGVVSFNITNTSLGTLGDQISGTPFDIRIQGMSGSGGTGSVITTFTGNVVLYSTATILSGSGTSSSFVSGDLSSHSMTLGTTGSITIGCINPDNPEAIGTVTINVTSAIFTGASSTEFSTDGNWLNTTTPASGASIQLDGTNTTKNLTMSSDLTLGDITISTSSFQIETNGNTLTINGDLNLSNSGSINASSGTVQFAGAEAQTIPSDAFLNDTVQNITIDNVYGVSLSDTLFVSGVFTPTEGSFTTNDFLFIAATDSVTYGQIAVGSGSFNGDVHFQMYINQGYHNVGAPVGTTINDLNENFYMNNAGYNWTAYNSQWVAYDTSSSFVEGRGIFVYFGANAGKTYNIETPGVLQFKGVPNSGTYSDTLYFHDGTGTNATFATTDSSGWNLLANPYPSNIDWDLSTIPANTNSAIYIWDPANSRYTSYSRGAGSGTNGGTQYVPPAQGFFIETQDALAAGTELFSFSDAMRTTSESATFFKNGRPNPELYVEVMNTITKVKDQTFIQFNDQSTAKFDGQYDAKKFFNGAGVPNIYTIVDEMYSINCLPGFDSAIAIPLGFKCEVSTEQTFTITLSGINKMDGWQTILEDKYLQTKKVISIGSYTFTHNGKTPVEDRFVLHLVQPESPATGISSLDKINADFRLYQDYSTVYYSLPNTHSESLTIEFYDLGGKLLTQTTQAVSGMKGTIDIPSSIQNTFVIVKVMNGDQIRSLKVRR